MRKRKKRFSIDNSPQYDTTLKGWVAEVRAEAKAEARAEIAAERARLEAEARATREFLKVRLQRAMISVVKARFPELTELAQQSAQQIENPDILGFILDKIESAENEAEARGILRPSAA